MRTLIVILGTLGALTSANAQNAVPAAGVGAAAGNAAAKVDPVAQAYAKMPEADRVSLQTDLIWTGDYNGLVDSRIGPRVIAAVKAFQKRAGRKDTGVLAPAERAELARTARAKRDAAGWRVFVDGTSGGARMGIPGNIVRTGTTIAGGTRWTSPKGDVSIETFRVAAPGTTLQAVLDQSRKVAGRKASYTVLRPDYFILSGLQGGTKKFYTRGQFRDGQVRGYTVLYDQAQAAGMDPIAIAIASTYAAFPGAAEIAGPPPRKKIEYGTAAFVDEAGYAVTTQMLVDGCALVTLAGFGPADIVATDKAANLALLRVYGAKVAPVALAAGAVPDAVSIVGVADPAAQAGGGAISTARAKVTVTAGAARPALDPAPPVGFDGAAALDASGRLAGLVGLPQAVVAGTPGAAPSPTLVPAKAVGDFLTKHAIVGADSTRIGAEAQRPAVTRLICVRK